VLLLFSLSLSFFLSLLLPIFVVQRGQENFHGAEEERNRKRKEQAVLLWLSLLLTGWPSSVGSGGCEEGEREREREREKVKEHTMQNQ
jgi:hypothetical protein